LRVCRAESDRDLRGDAVPVVGRVDEVRVHSLDAFVLALHAKEIAECVAHEVVRVAHDVAFAVPGARAVDEAERVAVAAVGRPREADGVGVSEPVVVLLTDDLFILDAAVSVDPAAEIARDRNVDAVRALLCPGREARHDVAVLLEGHVDEFEVALAVQREAAHRDARIALRGSRVVVALGGILEHPLLTAPGVLAELPRVRVGREPAHAARDRILLDIPRDAALEHARHLDRAALAVVVEREDAAAVLAHTHGRRAVREVVVLGGLVVDVGYLDVQERLPLRLSDEVHREAVDHAIEPVGDLRGFGERLRAVEIVEEDRVGARRTLEDRRALVLDFLPLVAFGQEVRLEIFERRVAVADVVFLRAAFGYLRLEVANLPFLELPGHRHVRLRGRVRAEDVAAGACRRREAAEPELLRVVRMVVVDHAVPPRSDLLVVAGSFGHVVLDVRHELRDDAPLVGVLRLASGAVATERVGDHHPTVPRVGVRVGLVFLREVHRSLVFGLDFVHLLVIALPRLLAALGELRHGLRIALGALSRAFLHALTRAIEGRLDRPDVHATNLDGTHDRSALIVERLVLREVRIEHPDARRVERRDVAVKRQLNGGRKRVARVELLAHGRIRFIEGLHRALKRDDEAAFGVGLLILKAQKRFVLVEHRLLDHEVVPGVGPKHVVLELLIGALLLGLLRVFHILSGIDVVRRLEALEAVDVARLERVDHGFVAVPAVVAEPVVVVEVARVVGLRLVDHLLAREANLVRVRIDEALALVRAGVEERRQHRVLVIVAEAGVEIGVVILVFGVRALIKTHVLPRSLPGVREVALAGRRLFPQFFLRVEGIDDRSEYRQATAFGDRALQIALEAVRGPGDLFLPIHRDRARDGLFRVRRIGDRFRGHARPGVHVVEDANLDRRGALRRIDLVQGAVQMLAAGAAERR